MYPIYKEENGRDKFTVERIVTHSSFYACSRPVKGITSGLLAAVLKGANTRAAHGTVMTRRNFQAHHNTDFDCGIFTRQFRRSGR